MLDSLGRHAVGFAPEGELDVSGGALAGFVAAGFVGYTIAAVGSAARRRRRAWYNRAGLRGSWFSPAGIRQ